MAPPVSVSVLGPPGAFVLIDERLVGRLPLVRPLLVAVGVHVLTMDQAGPAGVMAPARLEVKGGHGREARPTADGTALQVRRLPTVFVASQPALEPGAQAVTNAALTAAGRASRGWIPLLRGDEAG